MIVARASKKTSEVLITAIERAHFYSHHLQYINIQLPQKKIVRCVNVYIYISHYSLPTIHLIVVVEFDHLFKFILIVKSTTIYLLMNMLLNDW